MGYFALLVIALAAVGSVALGKLTRVGGIVGGLVALFLYLSFGLTGIWMLGAFFVSGSVATSWHRKEKERSGYAEQNKGRRNVFQVLANGGIAAAAALIAHFFPQHSPAMLAAATGALSAATADTLSSELGMVYGKRFFNILNGKTAAGGENGVISVEGTLIGMFGSALIAGIFYAHTTALLPALWIVVAGTAGNMADSLLGATLERKNIIGNNLVNTLNTLVGALVAWLLYSGW